MFKKRPKARIKIGRHFLGNRISATAEGYVIYKEYDPNDKKYYYWEEWELRGFNDYDSWIEYDHYSHQVTLYEPIKIKEDLNAYDLKKHQELTLTTETGVVSGRVKEVGVGIAVRREGTLTYHVFEGDSVAYAEVYVPRRGTISIENYNEKEKDYYLGTTLTRKEQKNLLGRVVSPISPELIKTVLWIVFVGVLSFIPGEDDYETYCTPRTVTGQPTSAQQPAQPASSDQIISQDDTQTCYRRSVYGGGGVGK